MEEVDFLGLKDDLGTPETRAAALFGVAVFAALNMCQKARRMDCRLGIA
jgi:hypothetical protein